MRRVWREELVSCARVGDSLLLGLEDRLSLDKGLEERLLTNLRVKDREATPAHEMISLIRGGGVSQITDMHCTQVYLSCSMAFSVLRQDTSSLSKRICRS